jgi:hypothetical protein
MDKIGFSTGSLTKGDAAAAFRLLEPFALGCVELSALRLHELAGLLACLPELPLTGYNHISIHAPSKFTALDEPAIVRALLPAASCGWLVVIHPDVIHDPRLWAPFGNRLAIENMDVRKPIGRTVEELRPIFARLPDAAFCFDIAHAQQCDASMLEATRLLDAFSGRLAEVHVSQLDANSRHTRLTRSGREGCLRIADRLPLEVPVIVEAPVSRAEMDAELHASLEAIGRSCAYTCLAAA